MKKYVLGLFISLILGCCSVFAQEILPDSATIEVKNPLIEGEAANLKITMTRNGSPMTSYTGTIIILISEENGGILNKSEYTLPNLGVYSFLAGDGGSKEFQKGLEIKKEGNFYIEVSDLNDPEDRTLGKQLVQVVKNGEGAGKVHIDISNPMSGSILATEKVEILAEAESLPNSNVLVYIDDQVFSKTTTDSNGLINHTMQNISQGNHFLRLEISDIEGNILGSSDKIFFTYTPQNIQGFKDIKIEPENGLFVGDSIDITIDTDDTVESVKLKLSDGSDDVFLNKVGNGRFSGKTFLTSTGTINLSIDVTALNNTVTKSEDNIKTITVSDLPQISNIQVDTDDKNQTAEIIWDSSSENVGSYLISYRLDSFVYTGQDRTKTKSFIFTDVPYDTPIYLNITPYLGEELTKHGTASQTIQFIIRKPSEETDNTDTNTGSTSIPGVGTEEESIASKCTIQNIATRTVKIGDNHYLVRDKVENVSKYIVYSSESPLGIDRTKVYETTDTSYEYPFDYTSEEDQFMYFRIVGICDDGEELELSGATKVQVGPVQDFFLLVCMTLLIYFGIRLFRQTEE